MFASIAFIPLLLVFAAVAMMLLVFAARAGEKNSGGPAPVAPPSAAVPLPPAKDISSLSREKLREMLKRVESEPAPKEKMGAMCYALALPPDRAEYVCPKCGQKTLHASQEKSGNATVRLVSWELTAMRQLASEIQKHTKAVALLEDAFCGHCKGPVLAPGVFDSPKARLCVRLDGKMETITRGVTEGDLRLLLGFFSGSLEQKTFNDGAFPLKNSLPRLKQLLGESPGPGTTPAADEKEAAPGTGAKSARLDYVVAAGDTGLGIARKLGLRFDGLQKLNPGVKWERLQIGQKLIIRAPENEQAGH